MHAGRLECVDGPDGTKAIAGSIVVHVMLDYSNLSFISAQSPHVELPPRGPDGADRSAARETVEFTVYGWSRDRFYMSGSDAWQLTESVFQRAFASRDPFWATAR